MFVGCYSSFVDSLRCWWGCSWIFLGSRHCSLVFIDFRLFYLIFIDVAILPDVRWCSLMFADVRWCSSISVLLLLILYDVFSLLVKDFDMLSVMLLYVCYLIWSCYMWRASGIRVDVRDSDFLWFIPISLSFIDPYVSYLNKLYITRPSVGHSCRVAACETKLSAVSVE